MEMVSKPCQVNKSITNPGSFNNLKKKENTGSQMGHIKKNIKKTKKTGFLNTQPGGNRMQHAGIQCGRQT